MSENKSIFEEYAEKKVNTMVTENEALVNQLHGLEWALEQMSNDPKMTAKAWRRAIKAFHSSRKKGATEVEFQHPIEEAVAKNLRNQVGIAALMVGKTEQLIKAATVEMDKVKKMFQEQQSKMEVNNEGENK